MKTMVMRFFELCEQQELMQERMLSFCHAKIQKTHNEKFKIGV